MKSSLFSLFLLLLSFTHLLAQDCNFPLPPSNTCQNAPLLCDLDGYCSNNANAANSGTPNAFCGVVENNEWVAFLAGSTTFILEVTVANCNQGSGLQAQVFSTNNCQNFQAASNCIDPVTNVATLTATNLIIGEQYYLMIDGKGGDVCDYSLRLLEGLTLSPAEAIIEPAGALCTGNTLDLNSVGTSPNADLSYQWTTNDGNILSGGNSATITIDTPGGYLVSIQDAGGCTDSTTIQIPLEPLPQFGIDTPDTLNCLTNLVVDLLAIPADPMADYSYAWSGSPDAIVSGEFTATPTVEQAGNYQVVVTDNTSGCSQTGNITVVADANTPAAILQGSTDELNCLVATIQLNGAGSSTGNSFTSRWFTTGGNFVSPPLGLNASLDAPGTYTLEITNQNNGCVTEASVLISENTAVPEGVELDLSPPCFELTDGSISILSVSGGTAPFLFSFEGANLQPGRIFSDLAAGGYTLRVEDQTGCSWDTIIPLLELSPFLLELGDDQEISLGCELDIKPQFNRLVSEIDTFIWTPAIDCNDCIYPNVRPLTSILYHLQAVDKNGCRAEDQFRIFVQNERKVFLPNAFSPNNDGTNDVFFLQAGKDVLEVVDLKIYNRWGTQVAAYGRHLPNDPSAGWRGLINGKIAPGGVYVYVAEVLFVDQVVSRYTGDFVLLR